MIQDNLKEIEFFDRFTKETEYDVLTEYGYHTLFECFSNLAKRHFSSSGRIIDLGCGTGAFTDRFSQKIQGEVWGVDISANSIRLARQRNEHIKYLVADISRLGLKDESFDVVIFSGVLHHFQNIQPCLKEAYRILKKGGCLLSYDPHLGNPFMWLYRHPSSPFFSKVGKTDNERLLSVEDMRENLEAAGFGQIRCQAISGVTFKYVESNLGRLLLPAYNILEYSLGKLPCARKIGSFLIGFAQKN